VNGQLASQRILGFSQDEDSNGRHWPVLLVEENLMGHLHQLYLRYQAQPTLEQAQWLYQPQKPHPNKGDFSLVVPTGHYFALGDNRDNSLDSRYWGFIPDTHLVGCAKWIFLSWDSQASWNAPLKWIRWDRIGTALDKRTAPSDPV